MADEKPVVYILHGDDPVEIARFVDSMTAKMIETGMADLNLSRLDGRTTSEADLRTAALALPFLAERRLVILDQAQVRLGQGSEDHFKPFLNQLPDTTALVLILRDEFMLSGKDKGWQTIKTKHWLWPWIESAGQSCVLSGLPPAGPGRNGRLDQKNG